MEQIVQELTSLNPLWVYVAVAGIAYIENIFPPFPSDVIVVAAGSLVGIGTIDFSLALVLATAGSTLGFATMYKLGDWFGDKILETGKIKFIPIESVKKVEVWFQKYGYGLIIANRFMAGTRAVVSFFAGLSELAFAKTVILSFFSALAWNAILLYAGKALGQNWREIASYLETYSQIVTAVISIVLIAVVIRWFLRKKTSTEPSSH
ncbi:MAG: DedA family protein [Ignavibacteriae bacterium]|nr:DedA family protein [Ignavibacteriota bacterium]